MESTLLEHPGVEVFSILTEAQLRNRIDPQRGIFIAESPKVIRAVPSAAAPRGTRRPHRARRGNRRRDTFRFRKRFHRRNHSIS